MTLVLGRQKQQKRKQCFLPPTHVFFSGGGRGEGGGGVVFFGQVQITWLAQMREGGGGPTPFRHKFSNDGWGKGAKVILLGRDSKM